MLVHTLRRLAVSGTSAAAAAASADLSTLSGALMTAEDSQRVLPAPLAHIFQRVKLCLVPFNAQDIYQVCTVAYNMDTIGMLQDADFMRGIADAFQRCDQTVLSPFQASLITDTLRRVNISTSPKEVLVPEEEAVSPESLLNVLRTMAVMKMRDERKMNEVIALMSPLLDEFSPTQLTMAIVELGKLKCANTDILTRLAKRVLNGCDDISALDVSACAKSLATSKSVSPNVLRQFFALAESRLAEFQPEDYMNLIEGLLALGPQYLTTFTKLVEAGLEYVEGMDAVSLSRFLVAFAALDYRQREHVEIYADALVDVATDLPERDLVQAFVALQRLQLLGETMFATLLECLTRRATLLAPVHLAPVMDVCSSVPYNTDALMHPLLDRAMECTRILTPHQLAEVLDILSLYPPARTHPLVQLFGRQAMLRVELMGPVPLAMATRGLARLGYADAEFYMLAAQTGFRYGFKDWSQLEPIVMGMCLSGRGTVPIHMVKGVASHTAPMARSMSLQEVQRAYRYLSELGCEDDYLYRALAARVMQFVKEVTPDTPQDLQLLLQRGALNRSTRA